MEEFAAAIVCFKIILITLAFPKDENHMMLRRLKFISKDLNNSEGHILNYCTMF
jgi:hypothetical protein